MAGLTAVISLPVQAAPDAWIDDLTPITVGDWDDDAAAHLLERAGFGGTPEAVDELLALGPRRAVRRLVFFDGASRRALAPFDHPGIHLVPEAAGTLFVQTDQFLAIREQAVDGIFEGSQHPGAKYFLQGLLVRHDKFQGHKIGLEIAV